MLGVQLNKDFYETHTDYGLALIHCVCSSNGQFELKVTHANASSAQPRFKNVIFRHHYVMQKTVVLLQLSNVTFAVPHSNRQNVMLISDKPTLCLVYCLWHLLKISH